MYASQGRVCAYCGCELQRGNRGDVDHFRPKARIADEREALGYWWLAYEFGNYLLACRTCNSTYKQNRFPLAPGEERIRFETRHRLAEEARLLLDPCADDIEQLLSVDLTNVLVPVVPKPGLASPAIARVKHTIEFFGMNAQPELTKARMRIAAKVRRALDANQPGKVRALAIRYRPHSLVARQLLERHGEGLLPSPAEEVEWLMRDMKRTLRLTLQLELASSHARDQERLRRDRMELLWSFAVLAAGTPGDLQANINAFVDRLGLRPHIRQYCDELAK
ncbi:MAG: hypothetical protein JNL98_06320 [Bryobacterales bacterium]|nr:hypothetical protein [Bryobacterales bacterium]